MSLLLGLLWAGSGAGEVWAAWLADTVSVLPCHARSSAGLATTSLPSYRGSRLGRELYAQVWNQLTYLQAVSTAVTAVSPCVQGGRRVLSAVLDAQRPPKMQHQLQGWAGGSNSCPLLVLQTEPTPSPVP